MKTDIVLKPLLNEKSYREISNSKFTFEIPTKLNKIELKKIIEDKYKVNVLDIRTVSTRGKKKRIGYTRNFKIASAKKKAIISLKKGQTLEGFSVK